MNKYLDYMKKLLEVIKRPLDSKFSNDFALVPMHIKSIHPVFFSHCIHLQKLTSNPFFTKKIHAINRVPFPFSNYQYIAEIESFLSLAKIREDSKNFKDYNRIIEHIENEINSKNLLKIVYESKSSFLMHKKWQSDKIDSISTYINQIPRRIYQRKFENKDKLNIVITATRPTIKGLFLLERIIELVNLNSSDCNFFCICNDFPNSNKYSNLNVINSKKMNFKERDNLFLNMDLMLNLSLGDTLGCFLDSIEYSIPMISFKGQHGDTYVNNDETGFLVNTPVYYYTSGLGEKYSNRDQFEKYIIDLDKDGFFDVFISEISTMILKLDSNREYFTEIKQNLYKNSLTHFSNKSWLDKWNNLYNSI